MSNPTGPHTPPASQDTQNGGPSPEALSDAVTSSAADAEPAVATPDSTQPSDPVPATAAATTTSPAADAHAAPLTETASPTPADDGTPASADAPEPTEVLPDSFAVFELPPALNHAVGQLGWTKPTPVQAKTFAPMIAGRDLLVQSRTGSGKTGAFCLPWLANRFQPGPARETGVQLLVMLPTRELAKQVCDELTRLAIESPVDVLAVYGGTAMGPQLDALRAGVHAVVGTPGRILDHVRRRSLDLSKVRTVVLDECDEMLSMGFLEDIRAILDACPKERQTCLFSATLPQDIVRIANRSMRDPVRIELSSGGVSASEIEHSAYILSGTSLKTHDLVDVLIEEDPAVAIIFCNTREETRFVAGVLQREGWPAEALSSDLTQAAREKVLQQMRDHELRFLVATDVAARGIDISHVSHVINFSFPETPESYVHRTGRTGRAGRRGVAISLIGPSEIGNFYTLRRQYPTIAMSERHLPSSEELAARRRETRLDKLSERFPELVSPDWTQLARWLVADPRGERIIAYLLSEALAKPRSRRVHDGDDAPSDRDAARPPRDRDRDRERRRREDDDDDYRSSRGRHPQRRDDRDRRDPRERREPRPLPRDEHRPAASAAPKDTPADAVTSEATGEHVGTDLTAAPMAAGEATGTPRTGPSPQARGDRQGPRPPRPSAPPRAAAAPALEDAAHVESDALEEDESDGTGDEAVEGADGAEGSEAAQGGAAGKRKRRRRRKKKPGTGAPADATETDAVPATEAAAGTPADGAYEDDAEGGDDAAGDDGDDDYGGDATAAAPGAGGSKKRRRRRRKKKPSDPGHSSADPAAPTAPAAPVDRHVVDPAPVFNVVSQEEIILDIDESELAEVRETFGEVDELDDLTLKARRRGVLDELQEEVVFEDLSAADLQRTRAEAARDEVAEDDDDADDDDSPDVGDPSSDGATSTAETGDDTADAANNKKKKRRRRKKKAPYVMPELVAPPHKDFWEVWASKFTRDDFSDERFPLPADPEPPPPSKSSHRASDRGHDRGDRGERNERPERDSVVGGDLLVDERDYVRVELNLGREHGRKSADIRGLLADLAGLRGRSVRDLTVADRASYFRMPRELLGNAAERLVGARDGDVEVRLLEAPDAPVVLRADLALPAAADAAAAGSEGSAVDVATVDGGETNESTAAATATAPADSSTVVEPLSTDAPPALVEPLVEPSGGA